MSQEQNIDKSKTSNEQAQSQENQPQTSVSNNLFQPLAQPTISDNLLHDPQIAAILQPSSS